MSPIKSRLITSCYIVLLTILLAASACFAATPQETNIPTSIRVVMDDNYPPYVFKGDQGQLKGIIVDQWNLWERKTGIHPELTGMDWDEAQRRMQAGEFDVIDTIFRNEKRELLYDFTKPYAVIPVPLFFHSDISGISGPGDAAGFMVAAKAGGNVLDVLRKHGVTNIVEYPSYEKIIEAARDGKVKVFTVDRPPALYFLNKMGIQNQFRETTPLYSGEFHRAVLKGKSDLLAMVDKGFSGITPSEYRAIEKKWMGMPIGASPFFRYIGYTAVVIAALVAGLLAWLRLLKRAVAFKTQEISRREKELRAFMDNASAVISMKDTNGYYLHVNRLYEELFQITCAEIRGKTDFDLFPKDLASELFRNDRKVLESGQSLKIEEVMKQAGSNHIYLSAKFPLLTSSGEVYAVCGISTDITDRKHAEEERLKLEQQLFQSQKFQSLEVLAGGIAHDFNNILTSIIGNADLALMRIDKDSPAVDNLHRIEQAAARAADLSRQMLAYSGKGKFMIESLDLNHLLEEMLHILEVCISKKATLRFTPYRPLPAVEADATQIRQIVMNLVINASEAMGDKSGIIAITTGCLECDSHYLKDVWRDENLANGLYVYLEIADSGCGMDSETLAKIFDPFFTTKFTGRGLGISAVQGIVRGHKGAIKVYSEAGKGSTFKIILPVGTSPVELFNLNTPGEQWQGSGTVLMVDDEETVREIGREMLQELGFTPLTATDGREAVELFKATPDIFFVILDLTMPHLDGEQCFRELRKLKPDVKVIMSSGYNEQEVSQKFVDLGLAGFIQKPYKFSALKESIGKMLQLQG